MTKSDVSVLHVPENLEPFIARWGLPTAEARQQARIDASLEDAKAFHDAFLPHLDTMLSAFKDIAVENIAPEHLGLTNALLALCEVDNPVNKNWGSTRLSSGISTYEHKKTFYG